MCINCGLLAVRRSVIGQLDSEDASCFIPWLGAKVMQSELTTDNSETHIPRARSEHGGGRNATEECMR